MSTAIEVPRRIEDPAQVDLLGIGLNRLGERGHPSQTPDNATVSVVVGQPRVFNLADIFRTAGLTPSPLLAASPVGADYYLVEFSSSFTPSDGYDLASGRLRAEILPQNSMDPTPLLHDLYPLDIAVERPSPWQISICTDCHFYEPPLPPDSQSIIRLNFDQLHPTIMGSGRNTTAALWVFRRESGVPVDRVFVGYLILSAPLGTHSVQARVEALASVSAPFLRKPFATLERIIRHQSAHLSNTLPLMLRAGPPASTESTLPPIRPSRLHGFLSYSHADSTFVHTLVKDLRRADVFLWCDRWSVAPGDSIPKMINDGLNACGSFVVVLSPDSVDSHWVESEISAALMLNKTIIPVLTRTCTIPPLLSHFKYLDFRDSYDDPLRDLTDRLHKLPQ